ncbi:oxidoreductase [Capsulimonas corticalis]|uniref:Oxidoreductase n=1 Tax=Capsulimonas corticalis TaxID=2219043 RepID=A0A402CT14_9BACT|nr:Gfo/Idh/MocA family oxidoreductase [Capsulimonas corticalis]BDI30895.1 oxidoreductase [Capsulimonas corticalis]
MPQKTLNVGLIGYKFMGKAHSNAYRQVGRFFDELEVKPVLKAICGRDEAGVQRAAGLMGWEGYETDWRKLIARDDIDIIDIAVPGNLHAEIAIAAAKAGKTILCEKPLGNTAAEAKAMYDAVREAGVKHAIYFNYRKMPAITLAKQLIDEGAIGKIYHWRATYLQDWIVDPNFPLVWRLRKDLAGSGVNGDLNAHLVDTARWLVGEIDEVSSVMETFVKQRPELAATDDRMGGVASDVMGEVTVEDASLFLARFASGAVGTFEASRFALGRKNYNQFEINGSKGSVQFNMERPNELNIYTEDTHAGTFGYRTVSVTSGQDPYSGHYWPTAHNIGYEHTFINFLFDVFTALGKDEMPSPNFYDGYVNNVILETVEKAAETKKWENVPSV